MASSAATNAENSVVNLKFKSIKTIEKEIILNLKIEKNLFDSNWRSITKCARSILGRRLRRTTSSRIKTSKLNESFIKNNFKKQLLNSYGKIN